MKTPEEIKKGLECCTDICDEGCKICAYNKPYNRRDKQCLVQLKVDARALIQQLESEKWELFDLLSSAWYGKRTYFKQDDGTVYSRMSGEYLSFDQAVDEFARRLTAIEEVE